MIKILSSDWIMLNLNVIRLIRTFWRTSTWRKCGLNLQQEPAICVFVWLTNFWGCRPQTLANTVGITLISVLIQLPSTFRATFRHKGMLKVCPLKYKLAKTVNSLSPKCFIRHTYAFLLLSMRWFQKFHFKRPVKETTKSPQYYYS